MVVKVVRMTLAAMAVVHLLTLAQEAEAEAVTTGLTVGTLLAEVVALVF
jgi:hypothetical protein